MATIRKRGDAWNVQVRRVGFPVQTATFDTKALAEAWGIDVEARMHRNEFRPIDKARSTTVKAVFEKYRDEVSIAKKGQKWEEVRINRLIRTAKFMQHSCAEDLVEDLRMWRDARLKEISGESVRREMGLISGIFGHAINEWRIPMKHNPIVEVSRPPKGKARTRKYDPAEVTKLYDHFGFDDRNYPDKAWARVPWILAVTLEAVMRLGEVTGVLVEDVHLAQRFLHLRDSKNGTARDVPLSLRAVELLGVVIGDRTSGRVFEVNKGTIGVYFRQACKDLGIKDLHLHDTRRDVTTRVASKFANVLELAAVTGHKDVRSLNVYYSPDVTDLAKKLG